MSSKDSVGDKEQEMERAPGLTAEEELPQKKDCFVSLNKIGHWKRAVVHLAIISGIAFGIAVVVVLINNALIVPEMQQLKQNIADLQLQLSHESAVNDENLYNKVFKEVIKLEEIVNNTMARINKLEDRVAQLVREISNLEASKVSRDEVERLSNSTGLSIAQLTAFKVDRSEFSGLVDNVSVLASTKADRTTVMELEEELTDLAATALNQTHFTQLQNRMDQLESSKAGQREFEELELNFTALANTTVRTREFHLLSERVENIDNTTVKKEDLTMKVTALKSDIELINTTLATKANQHDVDENTNMITTLRETTVRRDEFQRLETTVDTLQSSKTEQSDLDDLKNTVTSLRQMTATKTELNSLSGRVQNHITSSQNEHRQLTSDISDNDRDIDSLQNRITTSEGDIKGLKNRITTVEGDIEELKSAGSRPVASWLIITMAIIMYNVSLL